MIRLLKGLLVLAILVLGWLVSWSNPFELSFAFASFQSPQLPVFVFYFLFLFVGLLLGLFLGLASRRR